MGGSRQPMITVLNKVDLCPNRLMIDRIRFKYSRTVEISAANKTGFDRLLDFMMQEVARLRKVVNLRVPQSHYAALSDVFHDGKVLSCAYEENDILLTIEIPCHLEKKIAHFAIAEPV